MSNYYNEVTPNINSSLNGTEAGSNGTRDDISSSSTDANYPESVESFVRMSFHKSNNLNEQAKVIFQQQMKHLLTKAENEGKLWINDWTRQKVPILDPNSKLQLYCDSQDDQLNTSTTEDDSFSTVTKNKRKKKKNNDDDNEYDSDMRKKQRMSRFNNDENSNSPQYKGNDILPNGYDDPTKPIVGRCRNLEKKYYRLTSEPDPNLVRPQSVLQKSIQHILKQIDSKPYSYIKDQFKSIRQDMTVQHIKNDFTMYVYETNSRIAIENNDLGEFNQCVTQLEYFFDEKTKRNTHLNRTELEFICYRIIYLLIVENHSEIFKFKLKLADRQYTKSDELEKLQYVINAFALQNCILSSDYYTFFILVKAFEGLPKAYHLLDNFLIKKQRLKSLFVISKSYRILSIEFIIKQLNFKSIHEFLNFLKEYKLNEFIKENDFDCVSSRQIFGQLIANTNFKRIDIKGQI